MDITYVNKLKSLTNTQTFIIQDLINHFDAFNKNYEEKNNELLKNQNEVKSYKDLELLKDSHKSRIDYILPKDVRPGDHIVYTEITNNNIEKDVCYTIKDTEVIDNQKNYRFYIEEDDWSRTVPKTQKIRRIISFINPS